MTYSTEYAVDHVRDAYLIQCQFLDGATFIGLSE